MAIRANLDGQTLLIPGAYSKTTVRQTGGLPLADQGIVGIIGEAKKGIPGSVSGVVEYDSSTLVDLVRHFGSGPLVDAAKRLINCSNDARILQGANRILIYKTNAGTQSTLDLATGHSSLDSINYGIEENLIAVQIDKDTSEAWTLQFGADWTTTPGSDLTLRVNGGTLVTLTAANCTSAANTVTEINSKLNTALGTSGILYASTATNRISINLLISGTGAIRKGMGVSLEFVASGEYVDIGVTVPQQGIVIAANSGATGLTATDETRSIEVSRQSDNSSETTDSTTGELGGRVYMEIGSNAATSCTLTITGTTLTLNETGGGATDLTVTLSNFNTLFDLAEFIDSQVGYQCSIPADINGALPPTVLDRVSAVGICASTAGLKPGKVKADAYEVKNWFDLNSQLVTMTPTSFLGLPDVLAKTFMAGGTLGASTTSSFNDGFTAFEGVRVNTVIPLVSQDASDDLAEDSDYTDPSSTYDVESIHTQAREHCKKMSNVQNKNERDNYLGYRGTFTQVKNQAKTLSSEFCSLVCQDSQVLDVNGELTWMQPHITACMVAGIQAGSSPGTPATYKFVAANGLRHVKKQAVTPLSTEEFKFNTIGHKNQAIESGVLPLETPSSGGVRIVVHNTTYQADANFVFNRKHVLYVAHIVAYNLRKDLESVFVGEKAKTATAENVRNFVISEMDAFRRDELIVGDDTNKGLGYKNLTVAVQGNKVLIDIIITPVQGIDFVLARIELDTISQTA